MAANVIEGLIYRVAVLESISVAIMAIYLANARNDPDYSRAKALLDAIRSDAVRGIGFLPDDVRKEGEAYLDKLLEKLFASLPSMRGESGGQSH
jgi:hypothetical protein